MSEHKVKFYPVGNGDCSQIVLSNEKRLLFDFCHRLDAESDEDKRIDLKATIRDELAEAKRDNVDVFGITHLDDDHIAKSTEFFFLEHAKKYQGKERIRIEELWVPAAAILEDGLTGEAAVWRSEARYRLKKGIGIRVFSRPGKLENWLKSEGLTLESRRHLITDAGQLIPGFTLDSDGVEFFVHSPFAKHADGGTVLRNESALVLHATFTVQGRNTRFLMVGDSTWEVLDDIVSITKAKGRQERLQWDIYNVPHHCSYLALGPEKGKTETEPAPNVRWLLDQCQRGAIAVSSSNPISDEDSNDPPHFQAAATYRSAIRRNSGQKFVVTMEHPSSRRPKVLEVEIGPRGAKLAKLAVAGAAAITSSRSPRAGCR